MFDDFPIVKFIILYIPLAGIMFIFAPTMKWKLLFSFVAVPVGLAIALSGRTINIHRRNR